MENKPLKSAAEIAMEKVEKSEEQENAVPLKTAAEIAMEKAEKMISEEKVESSEKSQSFAEKNNEEIAKYFGKEESTMVKNYDKDGNEIKEKEPDLTTPEGRQTHINSQKSDYEQVAEEIGSKPETLEEKNQKTINTTESDYEKTIKAMDKEIANEKELENKEQWALGMLERIGTADPKAVENVLRYLPSENGSKEKILELAKKGQAEKGAGRINEKVQAEALKDFTREVRGEKKTETGTKWEGDTIMQAMEDFINQQKEKSPTAKAFGEMLSFVQKKSAEMIKSKIDKDAVKKAAEDFSKKSVKWATGIFNSLKAGMEKRAARKSNEALRIDEIMSGGNRSAEAIRVDEVMDKNMEDDLKKREEWAKGMLERIGTKNPRAVENVLSHLPKKGGSRERILDSIRRNKKEELKEAA